jgi:hypothetical protein
VAFPWCLAASVPPISRWADATAGHEPPALATTFYAGGEEHCFTLSREHGIMHD